MDFIEVTSERCTSYQLNTFFIPKGLMENMDNTPYAPKFIYPNCLPKPKISILMKKGFIGRLQSVSRCKAARQLSGIHQAVIRQSSISCSDCLRIFISTFIQSSKRLFCIFADFWFYGGCVSWNMDRSPFRWFCLAK